MELFDSILMGFSILVGWKPILIIVAGVIMLFLGLYGNRMFIKVVSVPVSTRWSNSGVTEKNRLRSFW